MPPSLIDRRGFLPTEEVEPVQAPPTETELPTLAAKNEINVV